jgi:drug/metabolite transporter (DMT)-like permease
MITAARSKPSSQTTHEPRPLRTAILSAAALLGFAANSLLCRTALGARLVDAPTFTSVRLCSGAAVLALLVRGARGAREPATSRHGDWRAAAALFAYAIAFSVAYLHLTAGAGALILFGAVQATMIGSGLLSGERLAASEWTGLALALGGLGLLALPGASAADALGVTLMAIAGIAWGVYSLRGRGASRPLACTAQNFARSVPLALATSAVTIAHAHAPPRGVLLAAASGAIASGVGYSLWYAALRGLSATRAAVIQLFVPALAALGGVLFLGETLTLRVCIAAAIILGGVGLAIARRR